MQPLRSGWKEPPWPLLPVSPTRLRHSAQSLSNNPADAQLFPSCFSLNKAMAPSLPISAGDAPRPETPLRSAPRLRRIDRTRLVPAMPLEDLPQLGVALWL